MQLVHILLINNNCTSFYWWWKEELLKPQKVSKYHENYCRSWFTFSAWFFHENISYLKLYLLAKLLSILWLFFFSRYQRKCVIKFLFRQLGTSRTLRFIFDHPDRKKRGKDGNIKIWISWERKELFRWNIKHFS